MTMSANSFTDNWEVPFEAISDLQWLGSGAQGAVFVGKWEHELVAVKKVKEETDTAIHHLRKLNHPNIIQFKGVCNQAPVYCIVMEFCPYGPLFNFLRDGKEKVLFWLFILTLLVSGNALRKLARAGNKNNEFQNKSENSF